MTRDTHLHRAERVTAMLNEELDKRDRARLDRKQRSGGTIL